MPLTFLPVTLFFLLFNSLVHAQFSFSAKYIDSRMAKVNDSLYASKFETTNKEYNAFVDDVRISNPAGLAIVSVDSTKWDVAYTFGGQVWTGYVRNPEYQDFPVSNIRMEGAVAYCEWLTEKYNSDPKRKHRKVVFTLPEQTEWIRAAEGGRSQAMFPWGNYYLADRNGYYLCNFKPVGDPGQGRDSAGNSLILNSEGHAVLQSAAFPGEKKFYTMHVKSFAPNDFGLYNMCGNVAEMSKDGYALGGSWNSNKDEVQIRGRKKFNYPNPEVGFRIFMRILIN